MDLPTTDGTGVYQIRNTVNGKVYVGSASRSFRGRCKNHRTCLRNGKHPNSHLQRAWDKYGGGAFEFTILQVCHPTMCVRVEQWWIDNLDVYRTGYNRNPKAGSRLGSTLSEETKRKISESKTGSKATPEVRARMSAVRKGRLATTAAKQNMVKAHWSKGPRAKEIRAKIAAANVGRVDSQERRAKISAAKRNPGGVVVGIDGSPYSLLPRRV